jgi:RNA 2',3'-cyclic 3'-phosphodiesterase
VSGQASPALPNSVACVISAPHVLGGGRAVTSERVATDPVAPLPAALRLFLAFRLTDAVLDGLSDWQHRTLRGTAVRVVGRDHLHVTAVFLGDRPASDVPVIATVMRESMATARRPAFRADRYRETPRVGMIVLREAVVGDDAYVGRANELTGALMRRLEEGGLYRREHRGWAPHVTVARFKRPPGLTAAAPDLGVFAPRDLALFESQIGPAGSTYVERAAVAFPE